MLQMSVRLFSNKKGSTTILLLGTLAVIFVLTAEIYRRHRSDERRGQQTALQGEVDLAMQALRANLQNPEVCTQILKGTTVSPGERVPLELNYKYDRTLATPLKAGVELTTGIGVRTLGIELDAEPDMATRISVDGSLKIFVRYQARLQAAFEATTLEADGQPHKGKPFQINRTGIYHPVTGRLLTNLGIPFLVWVDLTGAVTSCYGTSSAGSICNDLGGYFFGEPPQGNHTQSCRQSRFTVRLGRNGTATPSGSCRIFGAVANENECQKKSKGLAKALLYSKNDSRMIPGVRADRYLCMQCE